MNEEGRSLAVRRRERLAPDLRELLLKKAHLSQEVPRKPLAWPSERAARRHEPRCVSWRAPPFASSPSFPS